MRLHQFLVSRFFVPLNGAGVEFFEVQDDFPDVV